LDDRLARRRDTRGCWAHHILPIYTVAPCHLIRIGALIQRTALPRTQPYARPHSPAVGQPIRNGGFARVPCVCGPRTHTGAALFMLAE
jgi:hypothetical protein